MNDSTAVSRPGVAPVANPRVVRVGAMILGLGFLCALTGAAMLGQGPGPLERPGDVFHQVGKVGMLAGLLTLLLGYRWEQLRRLWAETIFAGGQADRGRVRELVESLAVPQPPFPGNEARDDALRLQVSSGEPAALPWELKQLRPQVSRVATGPRAPATQRSAWITLLVSIGSLMLFSWSAVFLAHFLLAVVLVVTAYLALATILVLVAALSGEGSARAFSISAVVPTVFFLWVTAEVALTGILYANRFGPEIFRLLTVAAWLLIGCLGILGAVVRWAIMRRR